MMAMLQCCLLAIVLVGCQIHTAESEVTFPTDPIAASVSEDATVLSSVVTLTATDTDTKPLGYTLESQNPETTPRVFAINGTTGKITVSNITYLDYETTQGYELLIKAIQSSEPSPLSATTTVTVTVNNVNEAPSFANDKYTACVNKSSSEGTLVLQVTASDEDGDTLAYSITAGNDNSTFLVGDPDGTIKVATGKTVGGTPRSYSLTITATDDDTPPLTGTTTVSINVADTCHVTTPTTGVTQTSVATPPPNFATTITASFGVFLISGTVHLLRIW